MSKIGYGIIAGIIIVIVLILVIEPRTSPEEVSTTEEALVEMPPVAPSSVTRRASPVSSEKKAADLRDQELFGDTTSVVESITPNEDTLGTVFSETGADALSNFDYEF